MSTRRGRLELATPPSAETEFFRLLARFIAPHLAELRIETRRDAELVEVLDVIPGKRGKHGELTGAQRAAVAACRRGEIAGATKLTRRWFAPQAELAKYLQAQGPRLIEKDGGDDDELEDLRARVARGG